MDGIIELPPQCFVCRNFKYEQGGDPLYECTANLVQSNDIFDIWDDCPYLYKKYLILEQQSNEQEESNEQ